MYFPKFMMIFRVCISVESLFVDIFVKLWTMEKIKDFVIICMNRATGNFFTFIYRCSGSWYIAKTSWEIVSSEIMYISDWMDYHHSGLKSPYLFDPIITNLYHLFGSSRYWYVIFQFYCISAYLSNVLLFKNQSNWMIYILCTFIDL